MEVPIPEKHCEGETCKFHMGGAEWFSNNTRRNTDLAPEPTITSDMYDKWHLQSKPECVNNPWSAPGTAKIYGSCGTNGGNPNGCGQGEGQTNITSMINCHFSCILHVLKEICMAIVVEVVVVAMKAVNLQSYMPQRACLMGHPSKNGLEERMHLCTGKWVLNIGEDMHTDSARFETFKLTK